MDSGTQFRQECQARGTVMMTKRQAASVKFREIPGHPPSAKSFSGHKLSKLRAYDEKPRFIIGREQGRLGTSGALQ